MYPRNAASPPEISIGTVVQISDGAIQTSGCTIKVKPQGGSWAAGSGTLTFGDGGTACYIPTQGETNYESFVVEVYKSGCIPASATIVTSDSSTAGRVNVATVQDKTGYALTAAYDAAKTASQLDAAGVRTAMGLASANLDAQLSAMPAAVRDVSNTAPAAGSLGDKVNSAASAGDPWATQLPGSYGAGTAGKIVGDNINATISSRSTLTAQQVWEYATRTLSSFGTLVSDVWSSATRTLTSLADSSGVTTLLTRILGTIAAGTHNPQSGDAYARLGAPAGASISADIAAVQAQTGAIETDTQDIQTTAGAIASYVDTEVAAILAAVDTEISTLVSELAKVPKSDGTVTLNATALAGIRAALALLTVDLRKINNVTIAGSGVTGDKWRPA
ncbi:MAG: hypothetical protein QUT30_08210 [Acidobacteriota bacterium]|nr:hypothetical protein [Acidobacteriota bacterium]